MNPSIPTIPARQRPGRHRSDTGHRLIGRLFCEKAVEDIEKLEGVATMVNFMSFGVSSAALVEYGLTGKKIPLSDFPHDYGDLERCEIAHAIAPIWLSDLMTDKLREFRQHVADRVDEGGYSGIKSDQFWSTRLEVNV